jgi:MFS transporter, DHA1 family, multidrug resistance protein
MGKRELIVLLALLMSLNGARHRCHAARAGRDGGELGVMDGNRRQLVVAVYSIAMGIGCLVPGAYADRYGRRPILLLALACYVGFALLVRCVHDFEMVLLARAWAGCWRRADGRPDGDRARPVRRRPHGPADEHRGRPCSSPCR